MTQVKNRSALVLLLLLLCSVGYSEEEQNYVPVILEQVPAPGSVVPSATPTIQIKFEDAGDQIRKENILMEVDRSDVTSLAQFAEHSLIYHPPAALPAGPHEVRISGTTVSGKKLQEITWSFTVLNQDQPRAWQFGLQPTATYERGVHREGISASQDRFSSNIGINSQNTGPIQTTFTSNLQGQNNVSPPVNEFDLGNFQATVAGGSRSLSLGDVVVNYDLLGVASLARRGIYFQQKLPFLSSGFDVFSVRSETIIGFRHGLGVSDGNQRVNGGSFFFAPGGRPENLTLRLYYLTGENALDQGFNFGGVTRGAKGDAFGIGMSSGIFTNQLRFEAYIARSNFDFNSSDGFKGNRDYALQGKIFFDPASGTWKGRSSKLQAQLEVQNLGLFFKSLGNPFLLSDRRGVNLNGTWNWGIYGFTGGVAKFHDNVKRLAVLPTVDNLAYSGGVNITPASPTGPPLWPSLSLTATRTEQRSTGEAVSFLALHNIVDTYVSVAQLSRPKWTLGLNASYSINNDVTNRGPDSDTKLVNVNGLLMPAPLWNFGPSVAFTRQTDRGSKISTDLWTYSWTSGIPIRPEKMTLDAQITYSLTRNSDQTNENSNLGGTAQFNFHLQPLLKTQGKQSLGLRISYNRIIVQAPLISRQRGLEVFALLDLSWPFQWQ